MRDIPRVGDAVIYHDSVGKPHNALVICVFSPGEDKQPLINMVILAEEGMEDTYGRQIERVTSICHKDEWNVHGNYWRFEDEDSIPYVEPLEK